MQGLLKSSILNALDCCCFYYVKTKEEGQSSMRLLSAHKKPCKGCQFPTLLKSLQDFNKQEIIKAHTALWFYYVKPQPLSKILNALDQAHLKSSIRLLEQYAFKIFDFNKLGCAQETNSLHARAKPLIVSQRETMVPLRGTIKRF